MTDEQIKKEVFDAIKDDWCDIEDSKESLSPIIDLTIQKTRADTLEASLKIIANKVDDHNSICDKCKNIVVDVIIEDELKSSLAEKPKESDQK